MHLDNICSFLLSKHLVGFDIAYSEIVVVEPANCLTRFWHFKRHLPYYILYIVFFYWVTSGTFCLDVILAGSHVINGLLGNITCPTFPVEYFSLYIYIPTEDAVDHAILLHYSLISLLMNWKFCITYQLDAPIPARTSSGPSRKVRFLYSCRIYYFNY